MKFKLIIMIFSFILLLMAFTGCSKIISIGYEHPYCEENGKNYQDAGVCGDPMLIYKYRYYIDENNIAYQKGKSKCE
ncbi:hypothetical protein [Caminibacter sp.]